MPCARLYYLATAREVYRIEAVTRSPAFSHLSSTVRGLATIRSFHAQDMLVNEFDNMMDVNSGAKFTSFAVGRWLSAIMDWIQLGNARARILKQTYGFITTFILLRQASLVSAWGVSLLSKVGSVLTVQNERLYSVELTQQAFPAETLVSYFSPACAWDP